jgi:hypothetical protein
VSGHEKMPPASHQVSATSLKLLIQQTHPRVRVERDSGLQQLQVNIALGSFAGRHKGGPVSVWFTHSHKFPCLFPNTKPFGPIKK